MARSRAKVTARPPRPKRDWAMSPVAARRLLVALLWLGGIGGSVYGLTALAPYSLATQGGEDWRVEWENPPAWADASVRDLVTAQVGAVAGVGRGDPRLCALVAEQLKSSPWIAEVQRISKRADGVVRVRATMRPRLADAKGLAIYRGRAYRIDDTGVRLPDECDLADLDRSRTWILIQGIQAPPPEIGEVWRGDDLQAGIKLVRFLNSRSSPLLPSIRAIDVGNYDWKEDRFGGRLRLMTLHPRTIIHWGQPPGEEYDMESPADQKLQWLVRIFEKHGGQFPDGGPIDLRDEAAVRPALGQ
ncbi:hypothetical protein RAS1_17740 [Phycisphaerae bacterium RAS1]|nr:hypothetical protein RAS1_17740 [Phycisphaerae bacterium RAS1]